MKIMGLRAAPGAVTAALLVAGCAAGSSGAASPPSSAGVSPASSAPASSAPASAGPPPAAAKLVKLVNAAVAKATSAHIVAAFSQGRRNVAVNLSLTRANDMFGEVALRNQPMTVLVTQGRTYIKITAASRKAVGISSAFCVLMCGKYIKITAGQSRNFFGGGLSWSTWLGPSTSIPGLRYIRTVTVSGQPAWQMSAHGNTAYIAAQGPPYPLRVVRGSSDRIDFTQWNSATIPPPPPASQVIDPSKLKHI